ncbi:MAG TPA: two-component regulator propeller domain-containing protein [Saprospiraceae bacterium]|nr:two-component regulator propeller domain-containing protein [Saprospiraceae bacterium]
MSIYLARFFMFIGIYCLCWGPVVAQIPPDIQLLDVADGLSHRDVKYASRDSRGFLWIMNSGIDFYDGQKFTSYNKFDPDHFIPVSSIRSGCKLKDSLLVFTEAKDLYTLNMLTGEVKPLNYPEGMSTDFNDVISIIDRQHHPDILLFTRSKSGTTINVIDRNWKFLFDFKISNTTTLHGRVLRSYANGPEGVLWLIDMANFQILHIDATGTKAIPFPLPPGDNNINYRIVHLEGFGLVLCRNDGLVLTLLDGSEEIKPLMHVPFAYNYFNPSHVTRDGWIWSISEERMVRFNVRTGVNEVLDIHPFELLTPVLRGSFEDEEGITWISTEVGLLEVQPKPKPFLSCFVQESSKRNFQFREILPATANSVYCRAFDNNTYLMEMRIDANMKIDSVIHLKNLPRTGVFRRYQDNIYNIEPGLENLVRYHLPDFNKEIVKLPVQATTQFNNLFLIDDTGMIFYQDINNHLTGYHPITHEQKTVVLENQNRRLNSVWKEVQFGSRDKILIGTETAGMLIFNRNSGKLIREFNTDSPHPLSGNFVNVILQESDSVIWAGTIGAGINRINLISGDIRIFTTLDGLPNNHIASMLKDQAGNIWIGTYGGLSMYNQADGQFYNYYTNDGLSNNEFNFFSAYAFPDGRMLMGTLNGLTMFDPKQIVGGSSLPPVQLTRIQKYNRRLDHLIMEDKSLDHQKIIQVSPYDNYIDLEFAVPSYKSNASHIFYARLNGVDDVWQNLGRHSNIRYQKLPPGDYQLELMASDANGNKTARPTLIQLHVQQVFYRSWWFLSLVVLSLLAAVYALYQYRVRMLSKEHQTRTRIASDLHDEVGGSLTGLFLQLQMMEFKASGEEKSHLGKAGKIIDESITKMRDLVWSIDARSDSWGKVLERMEDYTSDVLFPLDIHFTFQHQHLEPNLHIDARLKHNLYLIYKEAIHNIAKHSEASSVEVLFERKNGKLNLIIQDNGKPGTRRSSTPGQGMQNMIMRAERLKGKLSAGYNEKGFAVNLEIPI